MVAQPHFLLFCDTHHNDNPLGESSQLPYSNVGGGRWHFVLEQLDGPERLEAADSESSVNRERLALLSVVRGLEALEQPSQVTLVTTSRYVSRGLRYGLSSWRDTDYMWERFGEQRPVRNSDLWRRVDTALQFHGVKCRLIQAGQSSHGTETILNNPHFMNPSHAGVTTSLQAASAAITGMSIADEPNVPVIAAARTFDRDIADSRTRTATTSQLLYPKANSNAILQPTRSGWFEFGIACNWWGLAAAWIRWWRGRLQAKPAFFGT